jgi:hypothetical protein
VKYVAKLCVIVTYLSAQFVVNGYVKTMGFLVQVVARPFALNTFLWFVEFVTNPCVLIAKKFVQYVELFLGINIL